MVNIVAGAEDEIEVWGWAVVLVVAPLAFAAFIFLLLFPISQLNSVIR
jgi:hypothetical protein